MTRLFFTSALVTMLACALPVSASAAEDDNLVRLPGSGQVKSEEDRSKLNMDRLKPGGGLLASFDTDDDGRISQAEMEAGIKAAFAEADANNDNRLTAIEQQQWAASLPTRDDSLANPVRFDPNLDRRVSFAEFSNVIMDLARDYREEDQQELRVAALKAPKKEKERRRIYEGIGRPGEIPGRLPGEEPSDPSSIR
ncbi:EF-hand domain-containing protein [Henriciella sp.]|uniref:EF-hand domain-containing protein n=1 Tax=Henriciella sp. TaxID=1968823 RepID=UPI002622784E|nr:EF-hand domain-containing protein [Henriciella sp.]